MTTSDTNPCRGCPIRPVVASIVGALLVAPIMGSLRLFMSFAIDKILLRDPYPGEPLPSLQGEGFFSHMLYVKKKEAGAEA